MANYLSLEQVRDASIVVSQRHVDSADVYIDLALQSICVDPTTVKLPNAILTEIAITWAKRCAAIDGATQPQSPLLDKARELEKNAKMMVAMLNKQSFSQINADNNSANSASWGVIKIRRG